MPVSPRCSSPSHNRQCAHVLQQGRLHQQLDRNTAPPARNLTSGGNRVRGSAQHSAGSRVWAWQCTAALMNGVGRLKFRLVSMRGKRNSPKETIHGPSFCILSSVAYCLSG